MKESQFNFLSIDEATNPTKGQFFERMTDRWWIIHPERGLVFYKGPFRYGFGSPQCNHSEAIAQKIADSVTYDFPHEVCKLDLVWIPVNPRDFS